MTRQKRLRGRLETRIYVAHGNDLGLSDKKMYADLREIVST